eukprot:UN29033
MNTADWGKMTLGYENFNNVKQNDDCACGDVTQLSFSRALGEDYKEEEPSYSRHDTLESFDDDDVTSHSSLSIPTFESYRSSVDGDGHPENNNTRPQLKRYITRGRQHSRSLFTESFITKRNKSDPALGLKQEEMHYD